MSSVSPCYSNPAGERKRDRGIERKEKHMNNWAQISLVTLSVPSHSQYNEVSARNWILQETSGLERGKDGDLRHLRETDNSQFFFVVQKFYLLIISTTFFFFWVKRLLDSGSSWYHGGPTARASLSISAYQPGHLYNIW